MADEEVTDTPDSPSKEGPVKSVQADRIITKKQLETVLGLLNGVNVPHSAIAPTIMELINLPKIEKEPTVETK